MRKEYYTPVIIGIILTVVIGAGLTIYFSGYDAGIEASAGIILDDEAIYKQAYAEGYDAAVKYADGQLYRKYGEQIIFW